MAGKGMLPVRTVATSSFKIGTDDGDGSCGITAAPNSAYSVYALQAHEALQAPTSLGTALQARTDVWNGSMDAELALATVRVGGRHANASNALFSPASNHTYAYYNCFIIVKKSDIQIMILPPRNTWSKIVDNLFCPQVTHYIMQFV